MTLDCKQFLQHVLPHTGPYCVCIMTPGRKGFINIGAETLDDAVETARYQDETEQKHTFIAVGALRKLTQFNAKGDLETKRDTPNIRALRAYTMDLDAGPHHETGEERHYKTTEDARAALQKLLDHYGLPAPTVVQSGQGLHCWWTLTDEVDVDTWKAHGEALSRMAFAIDVKHDAGRTTGCTSVLRIAGRRNHKYEDKPVVQVLEWGTDSDTAAFHALIKDVPAVVASPSAPGTSAIPGLEGGPAFTLPENNTSKVYTPNLDIAKLDEKCEAWYQATNDDAQANEHVPEPVWFRMLQLAVHVGGRDTAHLISRLDPRYNEQDTDAKLDVKLMKGDAVLMGPPSCEQINAAYGAWNRPSPCAGCPQYKKITSPAVVSHVGVEPEVLPPNTTEVLDVDTGEVHVELVPEPPKEYMRTPAGIAFGKYSKTTEEVEWEVFCPYDMYPKRLQSDEEGKQYGVVWMVHYPLAGWQERHIKHVGTQALRVTLMEWAIFVPPVHIERMAAFMSAYTDRLQKQIPTEVEFAKCGWRDTGFVLGDKLINNKGVIETHAMSRALAKSVKWLHVAGDRETYIKSLRPYGHKDCFEFREFVAVHLGSIFYTFTDEIATTFNATGTSGVGKSTIMRVAAAMFGNPRDGVVREFTRGGVERIAGHLNHIPLCIDEVTGKKDGDYTEFLFQYSGGKGKTKLDRESQLREDCPTWNNICMTNSNTDMYAGVSATVKDLQAHLARIIQIEFPKTDAISKEVADDISAAVNENYGHAILDVLQWAVPRRAEHKKAITKIKHEIERRIGGDLSLERFKIAEIACAIYAMQILDRLGYIMTWPVDEDRERMIQQLLEVRATLKKFEHTPEDYLGSFLDEYVPFTLTLNARTSGNISNVVNGPNSRELYVRKELDTRRVYVSRDAFYKWCKLNGVVCDRTMLLLYRDGIILQTQVRVVLGAATEWEAGRVSCFEIDLNRLSGTLTVVPTLQPAAVAAIPQAATK